MKKLITMAALAALITSGCTSTNIDAQTFKLKRISVLQRLEIPEASIGTNGTVMLKGYKTDGGNEALVNALVAMTQMVSTMKAVSGVPTP